MRISGLQEGRICRRNPQRFGLGQPADFCILTFPDFKFPEILRSRNPEILNFKIELLGYRYRSPPEGGLLAAGLEDRDLALVLSRRNVSERDGEADRDGLLVVKSV